MPGTLRIAEVDLHIRRYRELLAWPSPARDPRLAIVAARTVCAVAALTGLARSEVPALQWSDHRNGEIHVSRKIGGSTSVPPKPRRAKRPFPSRAYLQEILANYKARVSSHRRWLDVLRTKGRAADSHGYVLAPRNSSIYKRRVVRLALVPTWTWNPFERYRDERRRHESCVTRT